MARCHLLNLPSELRNKIYSHILVHESPIQISERSTSPSLAARGATIHYSRLAEPAFLQTNHQIRFEALPIFYGDNVFFTAIKDAIAPFLHAIGPKKTRLIRHIRGFRPSRYFEYAGAKSLVATVERELREEGCGLEKGVFRMPFGHGEFPGKVFWVGAEGDRVVASKEGCVELAREAFDVLVDGDGIVRLVDEVMQAGSAERWYVVVQKI